MSLNGIIKVIKTGEWGISHGLVTFGLLGLTFVFIPVYLSVLAVAVLVSAYWYRREAVARETYDIREWYLDSQLGAVIPIFVSLIFVLWRYLWV